MTSFASITALASVCRSRSRLLAQGRFIRHIRHKAEPMRVCVLFAIRHSGVLWRFGNWRNQRADAGCGGVAV